MQRGSSGMAIVVGTDAEEKLQYVQRHRLHNLVDGMVGRLIEKQPADPKLAMLEYLKEELARTQRVYARSNSVSASSPVASMMRRQSKMMQSPTHSSPADTGIRRGQSLTVFVDDADGGKRSLRTPSMSRRASALGVAERDQVSLRAAPLGMRGSSMRDGDSAPSGSPSASPSGRFSKRGSRMESPASRAHKASPASAPQATITRLATSNSLGIEGAVKLAGSDGGDDDNTVHDARGGADTDGPIVAAAHAVAMGGAVGGGYGANNPGAIPVNLGDYESCTCEEDDLKALVSALLLDEEACARQDFHELFHSCKVCNHRPAEMLSLHNLEGRCKAHALQLYHEDPENQIFMAYDLTSYERLFWCCKCDKHSYESLDFTENFIMALYDTKGTYMKEAVTDMDVEVLEERHAVATCQGWRSTQEDGHVLGRVEVDGTLMGAVFDGHGGSLVADWLAAHFMTYVTPYFEGGFEGIDEAGFTTRIAKAMEDVDDAIQMQVEECGCIGATCCTVFITASRIYCANIGDSRAVLQRGGETVPLSFDHTLEDEKEVARVKAAGYSVTNNRIEGALSVPRAFGDGDFKQCGGKSAADQAVSVRPDVISVARSDADEFVIVACDGVWDGYDNEEAAQFVQKSLGEGCTALETAKKLILNNLPPEVDDEAIGTDNQTCMILRLK